MAGSLRLLLELALAVHCENERMAASARSFAEIPLVEPTVSAMPSVAKLIVCDPPAAMAANDNVWVAPLLARVRVT